MARHALLLAAILGFLAVALGAFGAHGLQSAFADHPELTERLAWWNTGVRYHMWHALLLVGVGLLAARAPSRSLNVATIAVVVGVLLFSGSLYVMTLTGIRVLGAVTPLGGVGFMVAWICVAVAARKNLSS